MKEYDDELVNEIVDNIDIVDFISDYVSLQQQGNNWFGKCPFHNERTASFSVNPQQNMYYCFGCGCGGNVINFCRDYLNMSYGDAVQYLSGIAGIDAETTEVSQSVKFFRKMKRQKDSIVLPSKHKFIDKDVLNRFDHDEIVEWEQEGIPQTIMTHYGIAYDRRIDSRFDRIIYPVYDIDGNLINVKGRTLCKDYKSLEHPLPKYVNYYPVGDLDYLQGLNYKITDIKDSNEAIIFESFKSVMKAESFGYKNCVSSETSTLSIYQVKLLISLHVNVVLAFDADIPLKKVKNDDKIRILSRFTNLYAISDKNKLLGEPCEKNSPVDCGKEIWEKLYVEKVKI